MKWRRKRTQPAIIPPWFWQDWHIAEVRRGIATDIENNPKMCAPALRRGTRHITRVLPGDETVPGHDPHRTDKIDFFNATTAKVRAYWRYAGG